MPDKYALGHSDIELERLAKQALLIDPITRRYCSAAGIGPGMRVLDIGSGVGDVAMLLAAIVGPSGRVIGTDRSGPALAIARRRAAEAGYENVEFLEGDPSEMTFDEPFDAIAGRYILQFLPDPPAFLGKIAAHLRAGGIIVFHELDWDGARSSPAAESYDACCRWCAQTIRSLGADTGMGAKLYSVFATAGFPPAEAQLEAVIGTGESIDIIHLVTDLAQSLYHQLEAAGAPLQADFVFAGLFERVRDDALRQGSTLMGRSEVGVWSTKAA